MAVAVAVAVASFTGESTQMPLRLVRDIGRISAAGFGGGFKKDCADLARRVSLLTYLLEEIRDSVVKSKPIGDVLVASSSCNVSLDELTVALQAAKRLLPAASNFDPENTSDGAARKIAFQFQCVTYTLEKALENLSYERFDISEEVQEQVELVRLQLRRATERYGGSLNSKKLSRALSEPLDKETDWKQPNPRAIGSLHLDNVGNVDHEVKVMDDFSQKGDSLQGLGENQTNQAVEIPKNKSVSLEVCQPNEVNVLNKANAMKNHKGEENRKPNCTIPDDFLCPISLELMRDPVIVSTGQTYERCYIQRWIDSGNTTCPKTQQKLQNLSLTPNYVLRSLIAQWCTRNNVEQPRAIINGRIKKSDGSFRDVTGDIAAIELLVQKLSSSSIEERREAVARIRSLSKRSTDNRILIAEAGAIPTLVSLLTSDDNLTQENAVTSVLNLSIYENNKSLIMIANAIPSIVQVLRTGSMEARENAAATLFSLSLTDENKILIGGSGAITALVELLRVGTIRGKKDAATALFNLCIHQGNKGRAVRAGIISALLDMLKDESGSMVDESLTILSVLSSNQEAKAAIMKANIIPVLVGLLDTGLPRNKENASAILVSLCKRDPVSLACLNRLGAVIYLTDIARNGTERAKRKANSLLELLQ
ncbi:U-box domain-containing protein 10-like [Impatiens glandulifera]|uniref:U-box domain-containing protein 10-like n=1 Tax=Impatiens glandulifera TaxID=253017 RepID=UPI001FB070BF|nr:U-box domain-containing protein 10-like [Impatiens glandulifera]